MNLSTCYANIRAEIKRGNNYDDSIVSKVAQAVRMIEDAENWRHMERYAEFTISAAAANPRIISQPAGLKTVEFIRFTNSDGELTYLDEVDPRDVTAVEDGDPEGYWQDGDQYFWLDNTVEEDREAEISYIAYTTLPADTATVVPMLTTFQTAIESLTMVLLAPTIRMTNELKQSYADAYKEAIRLRTLADEASRNRSVSLRMGYTGNR
jgi:hypothetical protein